MLIEKINADPRDLVSVVNLLIKNKILFKITTYGIISELEDDDNIVCCEFKCDLHRESDSVKLEKDLKELVNDTLKGHICLYYEKDKQKRLLTHFGDY